MDGGPGQARRLPLDGELVRPLGLARAWTVLADRDAFEASVRIGILRPRRLRFDALEALQCMTERRQGEKQA